MRSTELAQIDPVHGPLGVNSDGQLEPTTGFDFDSVDRNVFNVKDEENDVVELSEASRALGMIIQWACESKDIKLVGARVAALGCLLYADHMPHNRTNLSAIAEEAGCTKQCISKWLVDFREELGFNVSIGKSNGARHRYAAAQHRAIARGTHSSIRRRQNNAIKATHAACRALCTGDIAGSAQ